MTTSSFSPQMRQRWWRWGSVLAYGDRGPGFEFRRRLRFFLNFSHHKEFATSVSATPALDIGIFFSYCLSFPGQLASITRNSSFPLLPLEFLCKLQKVNKCLCSLSLSLLGPSYQDETGAARLWWRQKKRKKILSHLSYKSLKFSRINPWIPFCSENDFFDGKN